MVVRDDVRDRTIPLDVWYPAADDAREESVVLGGIYPVRAAREADFASPEKRPLILLSHGSGGGRADLAWLARHLARHGFLVASIEHPGNRFGDDSLEGVVSVWRRPPDLSLALDHLLASPVWGSRIDAARIGAAGHSSGGYTVIALAGARFDPDRLAAYCAGADAGPDCALASDVDLADVPDVDVAHLSYRDDRVAAAFAMAPAVGQGFDADGLSSVRIPVRIVGSRDDELTPFDLHARHYANALPGATLVTVRPGGHFVYLSICNELGRDVAGLVCVDPDPATDRAAVHDRVGRDAVDFFRRTLGSRPPLS